MPALKQSCGCMFDAQFVDVVHHETEPHHVLVGQKHESEASLVERIAEKVLPKKGKK